MMQVGKRRWRHRVQEGEESARQAKGNSHAGAETPTWVGGCLNLAGGCRDLFRVLLGYFQGPVPERLACVH
eukprot:4070341-Amphidinium_carterae.2